MIQIQVNGVLTAVVTFAGFTKENKAAVTVDRNHNTLETMEDAELARMAATGRNEAFETLIRRHYQAVLNATWRYTRNREDALDVAQEAFVTAHRAIGQFRDSGHSQGFRAWLLRIAANKALDLLRRKKRRAEVSLEDNHNVDVPPVGEHPERRATLNELNATIRKCMERLSPEHRLTLMLREIDGLSYAEIAEATGVPVGTVMSRLFKARQLMRQWLRESDAWIPPSTEQE
ncbi:MAG TPA: sigma-70 family RNA polymerase sigma factor [Candidatus Hydrogenedentes bacterium]|nr:sigma-70 family RNA polymerase sigma factor [Candidatus Hydrogenedentota bacterium]HOV59744.1 sigma-70 family RNA polymerase sigma factor [Candidatus Hydrogenedentota bacterium]